MTQTDNASRGRRVSAALALGVDLGTGSARAFLFDATGTRVGGVRLPYAWHVLGDGGVEAAADTLVDAVATVIDGALAHTPAGAHVRAVGCAMLWHTLVGVSADGNAVTPVYAWNDTRAADAARMLRARLDGAAVHARTGAMLHPSYPVARLVWLRQTRPALFAAADRWMSLPEYVWLRIAGERVVDVSIAAGSGLLDQHTLRWDDELLRAIGIDESSLSPLALDTAHRPRPGTLAHARWPALRDAVWRLPVGDGACANIGSGCTDATRVALGIGTSAAARVIVERPPAGTGPLPPPGLFLYRLDRKRALLGGAISNGGIVPAWLRQTLSLPEDDVAIDTLLAARPPAAHALTVLPFLAGERAPDWPIDATALIAGLRLGTSPLDILQAGIEAVAYRLALVRRTLRAAVPEARAITLSGGAVRASAWWPQLIADVLGEPVDVATEPETSSRGAALLALIAAGELAGLDDVARPLAARVLPDPDRHTIHEAALQRHLDLELRLGPR